MLSAEEGFKWAFRSKCCTSSSLHNQPSNIRNGKHPEISELLSKSASAVFCRCELVRISEGVSTLTKSQPQSAMGYDVASRHEDGHLKNSSDPAISFICQLHTSESILTYARIDNPSSNSRCHSPRTPNF
ncbi:hypothetical protein Mp_zg00880 [Marchantia polymorpha subsp. ruderalis]|uniref:Uncharacterized protein n=2 Tax=Marchantia polymorpha TaxID=3197 RepID=A0A679DZ23_MARPO|nr:hypothetical protein MARPO_1024s0002 [Marchantia polymorpha]BBN20745.1 hypothetical protein Mp_zg00880 [Marchantia polymorpha subsp. ruderalis]|eukprot:PTQ26547.1 hypothetical protein MARPO_1024s0002 [Marchantia polymorpha]